MVYHTDDVESRLRDAMYRIGNAAVALKAAAGFYEKGKQLPLSEREQRFVQIAESYADEANILHGGVLKLWKAYCAENGYPTGGDEPEK